LHIILPYTQLPGAEDVEEGAIDPVVEGAGVDVDADGVDDVDDVDDDDRDPDVEEEDEDCTPEVRVCLSVDRAVVAGAGIGADEVEDVEDADGDPPFARSSDNFPIVVNVYPADWHCWMSSWSIVIMV